MSRLPTMRDRLRAELTREIADAARSELAVAGPAGLSLRAVARRLELVPSAIYRYFPSRDHLLTALIVDAYLAVGNAAMRAERVCSRSDYAGRWVTTGMATRAWSAAHPHEWALVFGTPVPGYEGSDSTTEAALQFHRVAIEVVGDAHRANALGRALLSPGSANSPSPKPLSPNPQPPNPPSPNPPSPNPPSPNPPAREMVPSSSATKDTLPEVSLRSTFAPMEAVMGDVPAATLAAGLAAWSLVLGSISLERFGHYRNVVTDLDHAFAHTLMLGAAMFGLRTVD